MLDGELPGPKRLPFAFQATGGVGRLVAVDLPVGPLIVDRLELEVAELGTDPGSTTAERFQRRRTRLRGLAVRITGTALDERVAQIRRPLAALGLTQLTAKLNDGFISIRARAADGLAAADLSFRIQLVSSGLQLRALATTIRVHGHLPTPGPAIADRIMALFFGVSDEPGAVERPRVRGLCDVEVDLVGALLWHLMPPRGWRLPAISELELTHVRIGRGSVDISYGPAGSRVGDLGIRPAAQQQAAAHDLMKSVDAQLRDGHLDDAMRGYRTLLAAGGPDQPLLLERILALASSRPAWFHDGLELSRQALGRWPNFPAAHGALASITLAQGDAREAASHLMNIAHLASGDGDDDQAALAALAGARLLRVLDPKAATQLYQLALEHDPSSTEAADSLADRLADEQRWSELVRLVRARAAVASDTNHAVQMRLRLADVFVHRLDDLASAQQELAAARAVAPEDPAVIEMTATVLTRSDPQGSVDAWREVARLAEARGDHRTCARAWATLGDLLSDGAVADTAGVTADFAWRRALDLDPLQIDALIGLARAAAAKGDHGIAAEMYERMRGLGLAQTIAAKHELALARSLVALERTDDARASLRRATLAGGETAAEAHAVLAEIAEATSDRDHAAAELDTAISSFVDLAIEDGGKEDRLFTRAAELAIERANLLERGGQASLATADWQRAHELAGQRAPELARDAARTMLERAGDDAGVERRWIDAVLATRPPPAERAALLVRRADVRRRERTPDVAAAIADLHEALRVIENIETGEGGSGVVDTRRRAYQLEADLLAKSGDQRARAQALAALARMAERSVDRIEVETAAAAAWLAADEPAAALPHGARAHATLESKPDVPPALRREVLVTLGEAAWRQRAWPDVIRAYRGLLEDPGAEAARIGTFRYRLAVAADRTGDAALAVATLKPLVDHESEAAKTINPELRGQALRLYADLSERAGDLGGAAAALEGIAGLAPTGRDGKPDHGDSSASARADAMYRAGELFRRAERPDDAIRCLEAALRISELHLPALDALEAAWRERGDLERVSVILGRKVAATARHPARQKPLLSRLGDLQAQLERPDVALATHQRALEIDPAWRPSLRFVSLHLRDAGQIVAAAGGLAQLAQDLPSDTGVDLAIVARERQIAAAALAELVTKLDDSQRDAIRDVALPALERAALDRPREDTGDASTAQSNLTAALALLRGEAPPRPATTPTTEDNTPQRGRVHNPSGAALSLRDAAARARAAGKLDDALATLETANHVNPGDAALLRDLIELANQLGDHAAAARHLAELAKVHGGAARGNVLLELADLYYDQLDDGVHGREAMRGAAEAFGTGVRRDSTLRLLAAEASAHLAWDTAVEALTAISPEKRGPADITNLATALVRAGRDADGIALVKSAMAGGKFSDDGELLSRLETEAERKSWLAKTLDARARSSPPDEATALRTEAKVIRDAIRERSDLPEITQVPGTGDTAPDRSRTKTAPGLGAKGKSPAPVGEPIEASDDASEKPVSTEEPTIPVTRTRTRALGDRDDRPDKPDLRDKTPSKPPALGRIKLVSIPAKATYPGMGPIVDQIAPDAVPREASGDEAGWQSVSDPKIKSGPIPIPEPSIVIAGTASETASAVDLAAQSADRERLLAARRDNPDDPSMLLAVLAHLGAREPALRRQVLEEAAQTGHGRALAIALTELGNLSRDNREPARASALWTRAYEVDATYAQVWMSLADAFVAADDREAARHFYDKVAASPEYDDTRKAFAKERSATLGRDETIVSGAIQPRWLTLFSKAKDIAPHDLPGAIAAAEEASALAPDGELAAFELLERLYLESGDITAASEAIGRQLVIVADPLERAGLWRRRAKLYRDALGRDAEAYRCLKEAHACSPADPEVSYQLRTAAMIRGEWALAASLVYREIAAAPDPRERGALHLELALIYEERLEDEAQAQVNYEQALAFDPTIPAAKLPLARRYESIGRHADAARLFEEAAATARAADRASLLEAAARSRSVATDGKPDLAVQLDRAEAAGDLDGALELAHQLWRGEPGHRTAFRVLANVHRASGDLAALTELTSVRTSQAETAEDKAAAWLDVARLADELGRLDQAARAYDLALIEDPGHLGALDARGGLAFRLGDYATADLIYRDLASGESVLGDDELALRRSIISQQLGRDTEALAHAKAAMEASPGRRDLMLRVQDLATRIGDLDIALEAARSLLELVPLDDDDAQLATHFALVDLLRQTGNLEGAIAQLERVLRDHPLHAAALEQIVDMHVARGDWTAATRYLYQLVPLAPSPTERAERLYRLGEAVLVHLGDTDRADDVFLRASDLDPGHVPTLRRLLDVYWRADDPGALVEVAAELVEKGALANGPIAHASLAHALVAAALLGDNQLADRIGSALGDEAPHRVAAALAELAGRDGRLQLATASTAITEIARRGWLDIAKVRAAAAGTPVANVLSGAP